MTSIPQPTIELAAVMSELESLGTAQNRKIYARHGAKDPMFGVSFANLKSLTKRIKKDHALALALWETGNHDARILAASIADPKKVDAALLDKWVRDLDNYGITDALVDMTSKSASAKAKAEQWSLATDEWTSAAGWGLIGMLALTDKTLPDSYFEPLLRTIERTIHGAPNRTRYAMNNVLIGIGSRSANLEKLATAAAGRIGTVEVDHGETGCLTPDAAPYIQRVLARKGHLLGA